MWQLLAAAGAQVAGGLLSSSAAGKAAKAAAANEAANRALIEKQMQRADQYLGPYATGGLDSYNALKGVTSDPQPTRDFSGYDEANPDVAAAWEQYQAGQGPWEAGGYSGVDSQDEFNQRHYELRGQSEGRQGGALVPAEDTPYGGYTGQRQTYTRSEYGDGPGVPTLGVEDFRNSGYFNLGVDEGVTAVNQKAGARGLLKSGFALKGVTDFARSQQNKNYGDWAGLELSKYDRARNAFESNRGFGDSNFGEDRAYGSTVFESDRGYDTDRFDTRVNDLFRMTGVGTGAASAIVGAGQQGTNALVNNNNTGLENRTNASFAKTNALTGTLGNLASLYGAYGGGSGKGGLAMRPEIGIPQAAGFDNWSQYYG